MRGKDGAPITWRDNVRVVDVHERLSLVAIECGVRAVPTRQTESPQSLINDVHDVAPHGGRRAVLVRFDVEADLLVVLGGDVQHERNEIIDEEKSAIVAAVRRVPRDGKDSDASFNELLHVILNHQGIRGRVGTEGGIKASSNVLRRLVLSLRIPPIHRLCPVRKGNVVPMTPLAVHHLRAVPRVVERVNVVVDLPFGSKMGMQELRYLAVI